jgi:ACS family glucarate transporter-like MFS transporter
MLALIVAGSGLGYILRITVSIAAPAIKADLGLTEVQLGVVLSAFVTTYAIFQIPGGLLGERIGARRALTWLMAGWGVSTILMWAVPGRANAPLWAVLGSLIVLRGAMGAFQAPFFPVATGGTVVGWLPPSRWGVANALQNAGFTLATAAASPVGVWLIGRLGWRLAMVVAGPFALAMAALWWWYNRDDPRDHWRVNREELALIASERALSPAATRGGWLAVLRNRHVLLLTLSYFSINYVYYLFFNWFYYFLTEVRHVPAQLAGWFLGAQWILGSAAALAGGVLCDQLSARHGSVMGCRLTAMGGILVATPFLLFGAVSDNAVLVVVLLSVSFASTQLVDPPYWVATMMVTGPRAQLATGVLNTGGNLSGSLAAILVPVVANTFGWTAGVGSGVVFAVAAAVLWLWIRAEPAVDPELDAARVAADGDAEMRIPARVTPA